MGSAVPDSRTRAYKPRDARKRPVFPVFVPFFWADRPSGFHCVGPVLHFRGASPFSFRSVSRSTSQPSFPSSGSFASIRPPPIALFAVNYASHYLDLAKTPRPPPGPALESRYHVLAPPLKLPSWHGLGTAPPATNQVDSVSTSRGITIKNKIKRNFRFICGVGLTDRLHVCGGRVGKPRTTDSDSQRCTGFPS